MPRRPKSPFDMKTMPTSPGAKAVVVSASLTADDTERVLIRLPLGLRDRLKAETDGPYTIGIVALAQWALDRLAEEEQTLVVSNKV